MGKGYNPALLKLELLSCGLRVDPAFAQQFGSALKEPLWTRTGPTSTGIDLMLENGVYVSPAVEGERWPYTYKNSPFVLMVDNLGRPVISKAGQIVQVVRPFPRPRLLPRPGPLAWSCRRIRWPRGATWPRPPPPANG